MSTRRVGICPKSFFQPLMLRSTIIVRLSISSREQRRTDCKKHEVARKSTPVSEAASRTGREGDRSTHPFIDVVCTELHRRVRHNAYAIGSIAGHEPSPALFPPHLRQCLRHRHLVLFTANTLYLKQDLEAFEGRNNGSRDGAGDTSSDERCKYRLRKHFPRFLESCGIWRAERLQFLCELRFGDWVLS